MTPSTTTPSELDFEVDVEIDLDDGQELDLDLFFDESHPIDEDPIDEGKAFVEACNECERVCFETANHCLSQGGSLADVRGIHLLRSCARVCRTSVASWTVGSRLYSQVLRAAARMCEECATTCERLAGDRQLKTCAAMCRACGEACDRMAAQPHPQSESFAIRRRSEARVA
jgi:hypothetical protein